MVLLACATCSDPGVVLHALLIIGSACKPMDMICPSSADSNSHGPCVTCAPLDLFTVHFRLEGIFTEHKLGAALPADSTKEAHDAWIRSVLTLPCSLMQNVLYGGSGTRLFRDASPPRDVPQGPAPGYGYGYARYHLHKHPTRFTVCTSAVHACTVCQQQRVSVLSSYTARPDFSAFELVDSRA